ncbi:MAG TPA: hypothetical protein VFB82_02840 [Blastocatellia bacterium]|nr:hypothetical protein [Blastocatellia bacterium]
MNRRRDESNTRSVLDLERLFYLILVIAVIFFLPSYALAQLPEPPLPVDPTPIAQLLSQADKAILAESNNPKKVVEAYVRISDSHLLAAFNAIKANNNTAAERELDIYNKAIAEAGKLSFALQDGKRTSAKKIEQSLYRQIKTLESIEHLFPAEREQFAEAALKQAKALRVRALNEAFASGGVLKDPEVDKEPEREETRKEPPPKNSPAPLAPSAEMFQPARRSSYLPAPVAYVIDAGISQIPGDYLTEEEDDHVRQAQAPDERVKVFMKIADRRLLAITAPPVAPSVDKKDQKKIEEEVREWGALPKLSRAELLRHYARAIAECINKLEDAYERNPKSSALAKALAHLHGATDKHLQTLRSLAPELKDENETSALRQAVEEAETANKGSRAGAK